MESHYEDEGASVQASWKIYRTRLQRAGEEERNSHPERKAMCHKVILHPSIPYTKRRFWGTMNPYVFYVKSNATYITHQVSEKIHAKKLYKITLNVTTMRNTSSASFRSRRIPSDEVCELVTLTPAQSGLGVPNLKFEALLQYAASKLFTKHHV